MSVSHEQLVKEIAEHTPEYNKYEHEWSIQTFTKNVLIWGILGSVLGGALQKLFQWFQGDNIETQNKLACTGFGVLYLLALSLVFYVVLRIVSRQFDDWMLSTISGFIFALAFFAAQTTLSENIACVFR